mmetsp:Transcript_30700/g.95425  ORF Transcript_30700/g.95425 Transcript_30700/m.95425 type:complete len:239 (+) Transcript_30700:588-1304(+)
MAGELHVHVGLLVVVEAPRCGPKPEHALAAEHVPLDAHESLDVGELLVELRQPLRVDVARGAVALRRLPRAPEPVWPAVHGGQLLVRDGDLGLQRVHGHEVHLLANKVREARGQDGVREDWDVFGRGALPLPHGREGEVEELPGEERGGVKLCDAASTDRTADLGPVRGDLDGLAHVHHGVVVQGLLRRLLARAVVVALCQTAPQDLPELLPGQPLRVLVEGELRCHARRPFAPLVVV